MASMTGTLVEDPRSGLGVEDTTGVVTPVVWPFGYGTRMDFGGTALIDSSGTVVAHVGETIQLGGGPGRDFWVACGFGITKVTP